MRLPLYQVDAFSAVPFAGNPAAVVLIDQRSAAALDDETRQRIAAEMNLSETSFVELLPANPEASNFQQCSNFQLRWNTPEREVPLCGHATLAAAAAIALGEGNEAAELKFETRFSGRLMVKRADSLCGFAFEMSLPLESTSSNLPTFAEPSGALVKAVLTGSLDLLERVWICKRLDYLLLELKAGTTRQQLEAIRPDALACLKAADAKKLTLVIVTVSQPADSEHDYISRCFAPWAGINEDPVTGSAQSILAPFWSERTGKDILTARQCSKRGGELKAVVDKPNACVRLQADAAIVSKGELYL